MKKVRKETIDRTTFWKPDELLAEHPLEAGSIVELKGSRTTPSRTNCSAHRRRNSRSLAIERGDAERGKKLFYKSAAACFACHAPPAGAIRLGPDLAKMTTKLTAEELVDSVLRPSKLIDKAFAQVIVLTIEGKLQTGVRVSENDDEIVLRNLAQPEPITIAKEDVEEVLESEGFAHAREPDQATKEPRGVRRPDEVRHRN